MNAQDVYLDIDTRTDGGRNPITHLWLEDENGKYPLQTFVPEERALRAEKENEELREHIARLFKYACMDNEEIKRSDLDYIYGTAYQALRRLNVKMV